MNADLRRFEYALEPLLRRRRWELEALHARLGRAQREIDAAAAALDELRRRYRLQTDLAARAIAERLDPSSYPRILDWLARLRGEIGGAEERLRSLHARRAEVAALCVAQRRAVDVVETHRDDCVAEFVRAEEARLATDADRDWLSSAPSREANGARDGAAPGEGAR